MPGVGWCGEMGFGWVRVCGGAGLRWDGCRSAVEWVPVHKSLHAMLGLRETGPGHVDIAFFACKVLCKSFLGGLC